MRIWLALSVLLSGCAASGDFQQLQQQLSGYAEVAATGAGLDEYLAGGALASAEQSAGLIRKLGYRQLGLAQFRLDSASGGTATGCVDFSGVEIVDSAGELVQPSRSEALGFRAEYDKQYLLTKLAVSGPC